MAIKRAATVMHGKTIKNGDHFWFGNDGTHANSPYKELKMK